MRKLLVLSAVATLSLSTPALGAVQWSGQTWNVFKSRGDLGQRWSASHTSFSGGVMRQAVYNRVSGGIGSHTWRTYGTYKVRFRMSRGAGSKYAILLMGRGPHQEVDFAEESKHDGGSRQEVTGTVHWGRGNDMIHISTRVDMTRYHTAGLTWRRGSLVFTMDGRVWARVTSHVPSTPMHMTIQTYSFAPGPPSRLEATGVTVAK